MQAAQELAEALYEACPTVKPRWDQLGGVTQSVWIERAQAQLAKQGANQMAQEPPAAPPSPPSASALQIDLF